MKFLIILMVSISFLTGAIAQPHWQAAAGRVDITPEKPMWMGGYSARREPGSGSTTRLYGKILWLEDADQNRLITVTMDLIGVPKSFRKRVAERMQKELDVDPSSLFLNASHTHSGPMVRLIPPFVSSGRERAVYDRVPDDKDVFYTGLSREFMLQFENDILLEARACRDRLQPVDVLYSQARCGVAMNRRLKVGERFINSANPEGPVDHVVPVLQVRSVEDKDLVAIMFGYSCHNTVLSLMTFSGDYAGWAQQYVEEEHPGTVALFVAGCGGDQNPYPRRKPVWAERHGRSLANAVEAGLNANPQTLRGTIRTSMQYVDLRYATPPTRAALEVKAKAKDVFDKRHATVLLEYMEAMGEAPTTYSYPVQAVQIGDQLKLITLGGEVVVDYVHRLRSELGGNVWVAGYSNDLVGYIPSLRVLREGGYEGGGAMRYVRAVPHPGPWAEDIEELIVTKVHELNALLGEE
ncbi:neutral/alkaline non-lysosomal ceramidase N-terminal domain-containing protein [bacterium]|nr:neutral/alkaline non-lysosomal ceramidase N-terminal domain-containing protein [bacterium]